MVGWGVVQVLWKLEDLGESELRALAALSEPEARDALAGTASGKDSKAGRKYGFRQGVEGGGGMRMEASLREGGVNDGMMDAHNGRH